MAIPVDTLCSDTVPDFDLYILSPGAMAPVLYREKNLPFEKDVRARLSENHVEQLYVPERDGTTYRRYVEQHLPTILSNPSISTEQKTGILYNSAQSMVQDLMENPHNKLLVPRSRSFATSAVNFIFSRSFSVKALLNVTCYDYYTYTHSVNVFSYSVIMARYLGFSEKEALLLGNGALLHDIGKSKLDPAIITARGKLTKAQWTQMQRHPIYGEEILHGHNLQEEPIFDVTRHHHEKLDGSGYPDGLTGNDVSPFARLTTICDIFDALTTHRSYKAALNSFDSLTLMKREMKAQLDQEMFRKFIMLLSDSGEPE